MSAETETCKQCGKKWGVTTTAREEVLCSECASTPRLSEGEVRRDGDGVIAVCLGGDHYLRWKVIGDDPEAIVTYGWRADHQVVGWTVMGNVPLPGVDRLYAHLVGDRPTSARQREVSPGVVLDYDEHGRPIGVEVLGAVSVEIDGTPVAAPAAQPTTVYLVGTSNADDEVRGIFATEQAAVDYHREFNVHDTNPDEDRLIVTTYEVEGAAPAAQPDDEAITRMAYSMYRDEWQQSMPRSGRPWFEEEWNTSRPRVVAEREKWEFRARAALAALRGKQQ